MSGVGKTRLLHDLANARPEWKTYEGSEVIDHIMKDKGGLEVFKTLPRTEKDQVRTTAIVEIQKATPVPAVGVVSGHFSFPVVSFDSLDKTSDEFDPVFTSADAKVYRIIFYLDHLSASAIKDQQDQDPFRSREKMSVSHITAWVKYEIEHLERQCAETEPPIHFVKMSSLGGKDSEAVLKYIEEWLHPSVSALEVSSKLALHRAIEALPNANVYLLIDGDRTLCEEDSALRFFNSGMLDDDEEAKALRGDDPSRHIDHGHNVAASVSATRLDEGAVAVAVAVAEAINYDMLVSIFKRCQPYSFKSFLQASLYSKISDPYYEMNAQLAGEAVKIYPKWVSFLQSLPVTTHAVVVTSGISEVWRTALNKNNLLVKDDGTPLVSLIAGNRFPHHDNYLVDPAAKGMIVQQLRESRNGAFGDSVVDVEMLATADRSYIVIDSKLNRSLKPFIESKKGTPEGSTIYQLDPSPHVNSERFHQGHLPI